MATSVPAADNGISQFVYKRLKRHSLAIIVHPSKELAADCVTKVMKRHNFHTGSIYSSDRAGCGARFLYPCQTAHQLQPDTLKDIFQRQAGHLTCECTLEQREALDLLDDSSREIYLKRLQPLHFLPRRMFGDSIPPLVYNMVNRYLVIPEAYLVLHHCVSPADLAKTWTRKCLVGLQRNHQLTRVLTLPPECLPPAGYFERCDYLFLFTKDTNALQQIFKRAKLGRVLGNSQTLLDLVAQLGDREGLVIDMQASGPYLQLDAKFHQRVFWTTDIVRARVNSVA